MGRVLVQLIVTGLCFFSLDVIARDNWYFGLNVGQANYDFDNGDVSGFNDGSLGATDVDDSGTFFNVNFGYRFTPYFAAEIGYVDLGEISVSSYSDGSGFIYNPGKVTFDIATDGFIVGVKAFLPISDTVELYGRAGSYSWDAEGTLKAANGKLTAEDDGSDSYLGLGLLFELEGCALDAQYMQVSLEDTDVDVFSLGLTFSF